MTPASQTSNLPAIVAALRQERLDGELLLEQNDGNRRLYWRSGELMHLQSEVAGEQFGHSLLRQGILDYPALQRLLASEERFRLGEKVVQWGLMTLAERDEHLRQLQEQVMVNALEHPVHRMRWNPGPLTLRLSEDLQLQSDYRHFIWTTFQEAHHGEELLGLLQAQPAWAWSGIPSLLETVADLPLTPATAYALSFLGSEPISFETFLSISDLDDEEAARVLFSLWAVGALVLQGDLPTAGWAASPATGDPARAATPRPEPEPLPPPVTPQAPPRPASTPIPTPPAVPEPEEDRRPAPPSARAAPPPAAPPRPGTPMERARALQRQARQLRDQDRVGEAIRCLEQSVQLDPGSDHAYGVWLLLGQLRMSNPAWSTRAVPALQAAARLRPRAAEPWISMGEVYFRKGFRTNAAGCFRKALELDPSVPIPADVDLKHLEAEPAPEAPTSLFSRFRSILGGSDKN